MMDKPGISEKEYREVQNILGILAYAARDLPLHGFLAAIDKADTFGPILDPTLYNQAAEQMHEIKKLAQGLMKFQEAVKQTDMSCFAPSFEEGKLEAKV